MLLPIGVFERLSENDDIFIEQKIWADRKNLPELLVNAICLGTRPGKPRRDVTVGISLNRGARSDDLKYTDIDNIQLPYMCDVTS